MLALLYSKALEEKFSIILANLIATCSVFAVFGNKDQTHQISGEKPQYFFFGYNFVLHKAHNGYIAGGLVVLLIIFYYFLDIFSLKRCCRRSKGVF